MGWATRATSLVGEVVGGPGERAVGPHATGVGAGVVVTHPLEVLGRRERDDRDAVAEHEERHLGAVEELLDDDASTVLGEAGPGVVQRGLAVVGDDDALARGQSVVLDDEGRAEGVDGLGYLVEGRAQVGEPGGHLGRRHDLLGERLAALETGGLRGGAEHVEAVVPQHIRDTGHERGLGPDDDEVDLVALCDIEDRGGVRGVGQRLAQGDRVDAGVPGGGDDRIDGLVRHEAADDGVFAGT